jgi:hypothetical protein
MMIVALVNSIGKNSGLCTPPGTHHHLRQTYWPKVHHPLPTKQAVFHIRFAQLTPDLHFIKLGGTNFPFWCRAVRKLLP